MSMRETVFEKLARSAPVNKQTALGLAHTPAEVFAALTARTSPKGLSTQQAPIDYVVLERDGSCNTPRAHTNDWDCSSIERLASAAEEERTRLGFATLRTKNRPRGLEWFSYVNGQGVYRVRLNRGNLEATEYDGKIFFRYVSKAWKIYRVYRQGEVLADLSRATARGVDEWDRVVKAPKGLSRRSILGY